MATKYITYGLGDFDLAKFEKVKNGKFTKPEGGLWSSPVDSSDSWLNWVLSNGHEDVFDLSDSFTFTLKPDAKVLTLYHKKDLKKELERKPQNEEIVSPNWFYLDFEKLMDLGYDAVDVKIAELYWEMNLWDCDSLFVINPEKIIIL